MECPWSDGHVLRKMARITLLGLRKPDRCLIWSLCLWCGGAPAGERSAERPRQRCATRRRDQPEGSAERKPSAAGPHPAPRTRATRRSDNPADSAHAPRGPRQRCATRHGDQPEVQPSASLTPALLLRRHETAARVAVVASSHVRRPRASHSSGHRSLRGARAAAQASGEK